MHGWRRALLALTLFALFVVHPQAIQARSLTDVQSEQERAKTDLSGIRAEEVGVLQDLFKLDRDLQTIRRDIATLGAERGQVLTELESLTREQARLRDHYDRRRRLFAQRVRFYFAEGTTGLIQIVLAATDFADFLDRIYLLEIIVKSDATLLASLRQARVALDLQAARLRQKDSELRDVTARLQLRQDELAANIREREARLASLHERRTAVEVALAELERIWQESARPILIRFGVAVHTLTLRGAELEPDAVQLQLVPPRLKVVVSADSLNRFLGRDAALAGFRAVLRPDQVSLAGVFDGAPLELSGRLAVSEGAVLRFQPEVIRFFGVPLPSALTQELLGTGALDFNVADMLRGGRIQEIRVEEGRVTALASIR